MDFLSVPYCLFTWETYRYHKEIICHNPFGMTISFGILLTKVIVQGKFC
jgi:hypothetical protein